MFDLSGRTALVTGAGSGIGEAVAHCLAGAGAFVYVTDRDSERARQVAQSISTDGGQSDFISLDVSEESECARAEIEVRSSRSNLDILVNNAGIGHVGNIFHTTSKDFEQLYAVNVAGVFNVTKTFLAGMIASGGGSIVNIASIGGIIGIRDRIAYCTSKFAVVGFTKSLALDHATDAIRVNCVCPGRVETPFVKARLAEYADPEKAYREMSATQAVGRMGTTEEVAAAVLYLASDESAFVTGSALIIDGGWSAGK